MLLRNRSIFISFQIDYIKPPFSLHFVRFGGFFVVNVWCCPFFL